MGSDPKLDYVLTVRYPPGDPFVEDRVQAVLFLSSCVGSTIAERDGQTLIECYFPSAAARDEAAEMLKPLNVSLAREERVPKDWLELYQQSLEPIEIGERLVVVADASIHADSSRIRLVIPQERAFGTGAHESTALCLELLQEIELRGARCLDVGTGSGILAVAMLKLGARKVFAFDHDFDTFGIVQRNVVRNERSAASLVQFFGDVDAVRKGGFDVITMNIIAAVIEPRLPMLSRLLGGGTLVLGGITIDQRDSILTCAATEGLHPWTEMRKNEWWAAALRKP